MRKNEEKGKKEQEKLNYFQPTEKTLSRDKILMTATSLEKYILCVIKDILTPALN